MKLNNYLFRISCLELFYPVIINDDIYIIPNSDNIKDDVEPNLTHIDFKPSSFSYLLIMSEEPKHREELENLAKKILSMLTILILNPLYLEEYYHFKYEDSIFSLVEAPSGSYGIVDLYKAGGISAVLSRLKGFLHLDCLTVSGDTIGKQIQRVKMLDNDVIRPLDNPIFQEGGTVVLKGNLAPEGAVVKQSAIKDKNMLKFKGQAICFNSEQEVIDALSSNKIQNGSVIIIRYEGPKGGPGMPELLAVTATLMVQRNLDRVALITDGRFSGATSGPCIGHVSPEAYVGGPIAIIEDDDIINIDIPSRTLEIELSNEIIQERLKKWKPFERKIKSKALLKYKALVTSAAKGAILKF